MGFVTLESFSAASFLSLFLSGASPSSSLSLPTDGVLSSLDSVTPASGVFPFLSGDPKPAVVSDEVGSFPSSSWRFSLDGAVEQRRSATSRAS